MLQALWATTGGAKKSSIPNLLLRWEIRLHPSPSSVVNMGNAALVQDGSAAKYKESKMALYKDVKTKLKEVQERVSAVRTEAVKVRWETSFL